MKKKILVSTGILAIPVVWYVVSLVVGSFAVPAPWVTIRDSLDLLSNTDTWRTILVTIARVLLGFLSALVLGAIAGIATAKKSVEYLFRPTLLLMQGIPPILWSIPLILILGFAGLAPVAVIALICFPLVATNISEGVRSIPFELREMLDIYAPGYRPRIRELIIPHLKPFFAASVRLGLGLGIKASVVAEYFAANDGIGFQIQTAYQAFMIRRLFAWALILVLLILLFDSLVRQIPKLLARRVDQSQVRDKSREQRSTVLAGIADRTVSGVVELSSVTFGYEKAKMLFENVDIRVTSGEIVVISGDSGTGKTTLLKIIAGLITPDSGAVYRPEHIGFMFQDDRFLPWFDNLRNASLPLFYKGRTWKETESVAGPLIRLVGLVDEERTFPHELSGGMKKRLAFARSFACIPDALLMDEPFTGLHHEARAELWSCFSELIKKRPVPVVVVTHFPEEVPPGEGTRFFSLTGSPTSLVEC